VQRWTPLRRKSFWLNEMPGEGAAWPSGWFRV